MRAFGFIKLFVATVAFLVTNYANAQKKINFSAEDGVIITADLYETEADSDEYMILLHQADYSRGEYKEIAARLIKLGFNCLAIDLRVGGEVNYVQNETVARLRSEDKQFKQLDVQRDIDAAILYLKSNYPEASLSIFGSSFSASLALMTAAKSDDIKAVVAFSPGEFFEPQVSVKNSISGLNKPCFIACPKSEYPYVENLISSMPTDELTVFTPERGDGMHGAKTLWWESATRNEYWLSLLFFLNGIKLNGED